jgi:hypothetical protein
MTRARAATLSPGATMRELKARRRWMMPCWRVCGRGCFARLRDGRAAAVDVDVDGWFEMTPGDENVVPRMNESKGRLRFGKRMNGNSRDEDTALLDIYLTSLGKASDYEYHLS